MRLGLQIADFSWPGSPASIAPTLTRIARTAEESGVASLWVMDHYFQIAQLGPPDHEMLDAYSTLAFIAAATERVKLGTMVTGVTYRHPGLLMKTVTTLDVLSGGRAYLGIGAAWNEEEHRGLGIDFPPLRERFDLLEETLKLAHQMRAADDRPFDTEHLHLERPINSPAPMSTPRLPILVGGSGERRSLRLVARYADACNLYELPLDVIAHKLDVLRAHCEDVGRRFDEIERTTIGSLTLSRDGRDGTQTVDQAVERFAALAGLGIDHAIVNMAALHEDRALELMPDLTRQLADVIPAGRAAARRSH